MAGDQFEEEHYEKIARGAAGMNGNDSSAFGKKYYDDYLKRDVFGYDEYMVDVLDFESSCLSTACTLRTRRTDTVIETFLLRGL